MFDKTFLYTYSSFQKIFLIAVVNKGKTLLLFKKIPRLVNLDYSFFWWGGGVKESVGNCFVISIFSPLLFTVCEFSHLGCCVSLGLQGRSSLAHYHSMIMYTDLGFTSLSRNLCHQEHEFITLNFICDGILLKSLWNPHHKTFYCCYLFSLNSLYSYFFYKWKLKASLSE